MSNYNFDFTDSERQDLLDARAALVAATIGTTAWQNALDEIVRALLRITIDDPQYDAADREYSRSFDVDGVPVAAEWRHEFLMGDVEYRSAWAYDNWPPFAEEAYAEPRLMRRVESGRVKYTYRESDPEIVDRSLLRNGYRSAREGEGDPPEVTGRYVPDQTIVLPSVVSESVVSALTIT